MDPQEQLSDKIRVLVNDVQDPCSLSQGVAAGLVDMGMLHTLRLEEAADRRFVVTLRLRVTGPGCLYVFHFERELRDRVGALPEVASVDLQWHHEYDWGPELMSADVRHRLRLARERSASEAVRASRGPHVVSAARESAEA